MELDLGTQARMVEALKRPEALGHPADDLEHLHTHISHVLLAGDFAYKIKKPLDLGFLDFSTLERRRHCCEEELRLNSRLAPSIYLEVVPITGTPKEPRLGRGGGRPLDYAVKMRRFPQEALLNRQEVTAELVDRIAERAARFHQEIPSAPTDSPYGSPEVAFFPMQQNFDQIRPLMDDPRELHRLDPLEDWTRRSYEQLKPLLAHRKAARHVRECHGDMHLGNIALVDGEILIFDGIEFNPDLRWIDTINEVAFLVMDLEQAGEETLARRFLNRYLEIGGDYEALPLLDFYKVYRALVRAKVTAIRLGQPGLGEKERIRVLREYGRYVTLAESYIKGHPAALVITHGVSGSGKTYLTGELMDAIPAVRLRSDIERKRLYGLRADEDSDSEQNSGIYTAEATERTYGRLRGLARVILDSGYSAVVDAAFLKQGQREAFRALARELHRPLLILSLEASEELLRERIARRLDEGGDASEADISVLEHQLRTREPLSSEDQSACIAVSADEPLPLHRIRKRIG